MRPGMVALFLKVYYNIGVGVYINKEKTMKKQKCECKKSLNHLNRIEGQIKTLKKYNAHILKGVTPRGKKKYCIYIPEDKVNKEKSICSANKNIFTYTVKEGDTLFLISKRFNNI